MKRITATRPSVLGRMWTSAVVLFVAGVAGAVGTAHAQQLTFTHIAGSAWTGDGGQARPANLVGAIDTVVDPVGNIYVSQGSANRIRKITPTGTITTIVGGNSGFGGDGGPASQALINRPVGLALDASGNLYFVDSYNRRVRRIGTDGKITTVAGNGVAAYGGNGGPATSASLGRPWGLAIDKNGNLFVSDVGNGTVRKITPAGVISAYAGNGVQGLGGDGGPATAANLNFPYGIDLDGAGNLYIADSRNASVRRVAANGTISMYHADVGAYTVHVDAGGNVYFNDDCTIVKQTGATWVTYGSNGQNCLSRSPDGAMATLAYFGYADGLSTDTAGNLYFTDSDFANVSKITASSGLLSTVAGTKQEVVDGAAATGAVLSNINHVSVGADGSISLSDYAPAYRVRSIVGGKVRTLAGTGHVYSNCDYYSNSGCYNGMNWDMLVSGLAAGKGGVTFISNRLSQGVQHVYPDTKAISQYAGGGSGFYENAPANSVGLPAARGIALDGGDLYIAQALTNGGKILKIDSQAHISTFAGNNTSVQSGDGGQAKSAGLNLPQLVAVDDAGNVYVYESFGTIRKIARNGVIRRIAGVPNTGDAFYSGEGGSALDAKLGLVKGLAAHVSGVYFTSEFKLRRIRPDGKVETIANFPHAAQGVAIRNGYMYVSTERGQIFRAPMPRKKAPADFNGDARSDLLFRNIAGGNLIWLNADSATRQTIATYATENKLVGQGDFNGDGKADVVWRNTSTGANTLWRSGSSATVTTLTSVADQNWKIAGVGDFNGDGKADLFWHNSLTGANEYWPSGAAGSKRAVTALTDTKWVLGGIGDFDGDGKSDLFWRHTVTGKNQVWSAALSSQVVPITGVTNVAWKVAAIGDFNGDGVSDVLWRDATNGNTALWRSANYMARQSIVAVTNTQWSIAAAGDYDNDGIDDLVWRNNVTGENTIWKNANNATQKAVSSAGNTWKVQPFEAQP